MLLITSLAHVSCHHRTRAEQQTQDKRDLDDAQTAEQATPEAAALDTLKAWATVPYQNEQAQVMSQNDQQAQIKVSAEFKDNSGMWVRQEALT